MVKDVIIGNGITFTCEIIDYNDYKDYSFVVYTNITSYHEYSKFYKQIKKITKFCRPIIDYDFSAFDLLEYLYDKTVFYKGREFNLNLYNNILLIEDKYYETLYHHANRYTYDDLKTYFVKYYDYDNTDVIDLVYDDISKLEDILGDYYDLLYENFKKYVVTYDMI